MLEVIQTETIADFSPEDWDAAALHPLASFGWLRTLEQTDGGYRRFLYLATRDEQGIGAAFQCSVYSSQMSSLDHLVYGATAPIARAVGMGISPAISAQKRTLRPGMSPEQQRRHLTGLLDALEECAAERRCRMFFEQVIHSESGQVGSVAGASLSDAETALEAVLLERGLLWGSDLPVAYLETSPAWVDFSDYRRALKRQHPKTAKHIKLELNRQARHELTIQEVDDPAEHPRFFALLESHNRRLNPMGRFHAPDWLDRLRANLGDRMRLRVAWRRDQLAGISVGVLHRDRLAYPKVGIDHQVGRRADAYSNLSYNHGIAAAINLGVRQIYYGTLAYNTKLRRGCSLQHTRFYVAMPGRAERLLFQPLMAVRNMRMKRKFGATVMDPNTELPGLGPFDAKEELEGALG